MPWRLYVLPAPLPNSPAALSAESPPLQRSKFMIAPFIARIVGSLQWICPNCSWMHGSKTLSWRRPRVTCRSCDARWLVGIAVRGNQSPAPFNAFRAGTWKSGPVNNGDASIESYFDAVARFTGSIELVCPGCGKSSKQAIQAPFGEVSCPCGELLIVAPIFYRLDVHSSRYSPSDWTPHAQPIQGHQDEPDAQTAGAL